MECSGRYGGREACRLKREGGVGKREDLWAGSLLPGALK